MENLTHYELSKRGSIYKAWNLMQEGKQAESFNEANSVSPEDSFFYDARVLCGEIKTSMKEYETAEQYLNEAIELKPHLPNAYMRRAWVRYFQQKLELALNDIEKAEIIIETNDNLRIEDWVITGISQAKDAITSQLEKPKNNNTDNEINSDDFLGRLLHSKFIKNYKNPIFLLKSKLNKKWIRKVFYDLESKHSPNNLQIFQDFLAEEIELIYTEYQKLIYPSSLIKCASWLHLVNLESHNLENLEKTPQFAEYFRQKLEIIEEKAQSLQIVFKGKIKSYFNDSYFSYRILKEFTNYLSARPRFTNFIDQKVKIEIIKSLIDISPNYRAGLILLGEIYLEEGEIQKATQYAKKVLAIQGSCPETKKLLYRIFKSQQQQDSSFKTTDMFTGDLSNCFCSEPFTNFSTSGSGDVFLCCVGWLPFSIGNVNEISESDNPVDEIWNSSTAQEIRRSILDGDFQYCSRMLCPHIIHNKLPKKSEITDPQFKNYIENKITHISESPRKIQLSHDGSCNIACPSCRKEIYVADTSQQEQMKKVEKELLLPMLAKTEGTLMVCGWGDPFASKHYRSLLKQLSQQNYPKLKVKIQTNGLLLTPTMWESLGKVTEMIYQIDVSIDAATSKTYSKVRFPGDWSKLLHNLEFISQIRQKNMIDIFCLNFVVQEANFQEMAEFVELGIKLNVDWIQFQKLWNFGSYDSKNFLANDIINPDHPKHKEFVNIIKNPIFTTENPRIILSGLPSFSSFSEKAC